MPEANKGVVDVRIVILCIVVSAFFLGGVINKTSSNIVLGATIGITLFIICFLSAKYALYILVFSMLLSPEFGSRTTEGGGVTIRLDDLFLVIISFGWFARTAIYKELGFVRKTPLNRPILYYVLACLVTTAFGMMFGKVQFVKGSFFVLKYIEYFVVYFLAINYLHDRKQIRNLVIALIVVFVIVCLASIAQIPKGERITAPFEGKGGEPNTLGGYLLLLMSVIIGIFLTTGKQDSFRYKASLIGMVFLATIPILFSQSRGTWFSIIPWYIALLAASKRKALLTAVLVLGVAIGPFVLPKAVKERFMYTFKRQQGWAYQYQEHVGGVVLDTSTSERVSSMKKALAAYLQHPVFGYGITGWRFLDAQYLKTLVETGMVGFTAFGFLLYTVLRETWKTYHGTEDKFYKGIALGFFAGIVAMMTHALGANTFIIVRIMEPFWFLMAIVIAIPLVEAAEKSQKTEKTDQSATGMEPVAKKPSHVFM